MTQLAAHRTTEDIWQEFSEKLYGFIAKRINNQDDIRDILQDIFYKIHSKKHTIRDTSRLTSWIYQITRNAIIDYYKQAGNTEKLAETFEIEDRNAYKSLSPCLNPFIDRLSNPEKDLLLKTDVEGMNQKKMAEDASIPYSTLKAQVQRTREKLRKMFLECCELEFDKLGKVIESNPKKGNCNC